MVKGALKLLLPLVWAGVASLAVARPDLNLPPSRQLTNRAQSLPNALGPPSFPPYTYVGCYIAYSGNPVNFQVPIPLLTGPTVTSATLTYQTCAIFCAAYTYFGIQNGNTCQCGNSLPPTTLIPPVLPVPDLLCNVPCSGNLNLVCGALGLFVVFRAPAIISSIAFPNAFFH
jgi:hypothetical protein